MSGCINLMKKNFLIIRNYYGIVILSAVIIPFVVSKSASVYYGGILPLFMQVAFTLYFAYNQLAFVESKYNSNTFLCITPYARKTQVAAMYITVLAIYCVILVIYYILSLLPVGNIPSFTFSRVVIVTCILVVMYSIFIPALYLLGYDKAKYAPAVTTFVIPYVAVLISKITFPQIGVFLDLHLIKKYGMLIMCVLVLVFLGVSVKMAEKWYDKKEL